MRSSEAVIKRGRGSIMLKDTVINELATVRQEIERDDEQERALLEGWEKALLWVLRKIESEVA